MNVKRMFEWMDEFINLKCLGILLFSLSQFLLKHSSVEKEKQGKNKTLYYLSQGSSSPNSSFLFFPTEHTCACNFMHFSFKKFL